MTTASDNCLNAYLLDVVDRSILLDLERRGGLRVMYQGRGVRIILVGIMMVVRKPFCFGCVGKRGFVSFVSNVSVGISL